MQWGVPDGTSVHPDSWLLTLSTCAITGLITCVHKDCITGRMRKYNMQAMTPAKNQERGRERERKRDEEGGVRERTKWWRETNVYQYGTSIHPESWLLTLVGTFCHQMSHMVSYVHPQSWLLTLKHWCNYMVNNMCVQKWYQRTHA